MNLTEDKLNNRDNLARVEVTKAKVFLAEGRYNKALFLIANVIRSLEKRGESALLAEALTIQGIILCKLRKFERSIFKLREAIDTATYADASHKAGLATLTLIEEHWKEERLTQEEVYDFHNQADEFLRDTNDPEEIARLRFCAKLVTEKSSLQRPLTNKTPLVKRKRSSIIRLREPNRIAHCKALDEQQIRILHIEDNPAVANLVKQMLLMQDWHVETCTKGSIGLKFLEGKTYYDIVILDNELPDVKGIELARRARRLEHRQNTPIVMFSAVFDEQEVFDAGVNVALKKPEDTMKLVTKIKLLIDKNKDTTEPE